ncbi:Cobalamin biosynthesis protein cbiB [Methanobacterium lacus]|uniref:Probable cobalamin biosynthesis protein CobD n=1 Tax=Methanobacterium lacus (strain AL-21) TaxID=877455 RepID=F0T7D5_METLA|nr:cobalamin biosynthesis protein [Methanobacterium lacus]ADZ08364.1 Cobalamin biosynthesis protein cbiB [Methanobacterium lacus]
MNLIIIILAAVLIDILFGELPSRIHPVVLIGKLINYLIRSLNNHNTKFTGLIITILTLIIPLIIIYTLLDLSKFNYYIYLLVAAIVLSTTFAIRSLITSVKKIEEDLNEDIEKAKHSISYLVSRETSDLEESDIISAAIETLTENITDSITAPLIYTFIFGILGAVFYRVVNTLDAMMGYKTPKYINTGWYPAKLDDLLNYVPARITGFLMVMAAWILRMNWKNSYKIMVRDARKTPSPNSGYTMAATAGALEIQLEKKGVYQLGEQIHPLRIETISRTILLTKVVVLIFLIISVLCYTILTIIIMNWI